MGKYKKEVSIMYLENLSYIEPVLEKALNNKEFAGGTVSILHKGEEVYKKHFGYANLETHTAPDDNTIYRMYSMTKPVTAVAVLMLMELGLLGYNDDVSTYLENFKNPTVLDWNTKKGKPLGRPLRVRDLLTMTSGLVYPADWSESSIQMAKLFDENTELIKQGGGMSTVDFCNRMGSIPLVCEPGGTWMYGTSADVLGAIVEVVSGRSFGEFLHDEIFEPLNMVDTGFYIPEEKYSHLAGCYYFKSEDDPLHPMDFMNLCITDYKKPPKFESGGAGLVSTMRDYQQFVKMLLNYGTLNGKRILGRKSIELMKTPYLKPEYALHDNNIGYNYGCLVRILEDKHLAGTNASLGEFGWDGWTGTYFNVDHQEDLSVMVFVQQCGSGFNETTKRIRSIVYGAL
jgi:CubicO group peptidase (beta-lactamase class C family)